jgi:hypothetical protein
MSHVILSMPMSASTHPAVCARPLTSPQSGHPPSKKAQMRPFVQKLHSPSLLISIKFYLN